MSTMPLLHVCDMYIKSWCKLNGYHSYNKWRKSNIWKNIILEFSYIQKQFLSSLRKRIIRRNLNFQNLRMPCANVVEIDPVVLEKKKKIWRVSDNDASNNNGQPANFDQLSLWLRWAKYISDERWNFLSKINKLPSQSLSIRHSQTWLQLLKWKLRQV